VNFSNTIAMLPYTLNSVPKNLMMKTDFTEIFIIQWGDEYPKERRYTCAGKQMIKVKKCFHDLTLHFMNF